MMLRNETLVTNYANQQAIEYKTTECTVNHTTALNEALQLKLAQDPDTFILGQGATDPAHIFGVARDLKEKFGGNCVFDTPVSEESLMGICIVAAIMQINRCNVTFKLFNL